MVGAWCFVDHMGPGHVGDTGGLDVGPHPRIGLQTVTWLVHGALLHRDSLGSEQVIRPGQLNLMTAGHGVSPLWRDSQRPPKETPPSSTTPSSPGLHRRFSGNGARRHVSRRHALRAGRTTVPLEAGFEHAVLALGPGVSVSRRRLHEGHLSYLGVGRDKLVIDAPQAVQVLLIGGIPFDEQLLMWWNYVPRSREEVIDAHEQWSHGTERFGRVDSPLLRILATGPSWPTTT